MEVFLLSRKKLLMAVLLLQQICYDLTKLYPNGMQSICIITFSKVLTKPLIDIIVGHRLIGLMSELVWVILKIISVGSK